MATSTQTAAPLAPGFFEGKNPSRIILAAFPAITVPLVASVILPVDQRFQLIYIWLFGLTHFVLTLSFYLQRENLRHFTATARNIFLFIVVPVTILMGFYVIGVFQLRLRFPAAAVGLAVMVRLLDFNHLNRQTFGVYQLFKGRIGLRPTTAMRRAELGFLSCVTALLFATFLAGGTSPLLQSGGWSGIRLTVPRPGPPLLPISLLQAAAAAAGILAIAFAAASVLLLTRVWRTAGRPPGLLQALSYLGFQSLSALLSIVSLPLYFATLAIHYVEYHVLMFPRCFHSQLDDKSTLDRWFGGLRRHRVVFYGAIVAAAGVVLLFTSARGNATTHPLRYLAVVSIFDGLFVFHYFVETLVWRFSDPFFRKNLTSLYFRPRVRAS